MFRNSIFDFSSCRGRVGSGRLVLGRSHNDVIVDVYVTGDESGESERVSQVTLRCSTALMAETLISYLHRRVI